MKFSWAAIMVLGLAVGLAGLVFTLQGLGYVGPVGGLMYNNPIWVSNGEIAVVAGAVAAIVGYALGRRARAPT